MTATVKSEIADKLGLEDGSLQIPNNFLQTVPGPRGTLQVNALAHFFAMTSLELLLPSFIVCKPFPNRRVKASIVNEFCGNQQTDALMSMLNLKHVVTIPAAEDAGGNVNDDNEIDIDWNH
jgi:hypothetical protein